MLGQLIPTVEMSSTVVFGVLGTRIVLVVFCSTS
jgi:hypothetical protein